MATFKIFVFLLVLFTALPQQYAQDDDDADVQTDVPDELEDEELKPPEPPKERPVYKAPEVKGNAYFTEAFLSEDNFSKRWILSQAKKDDIDENLAKYDGQWVVEEPSSSPLKGDFALVLKSKAKHHAVSAPLDRPYEFSGKPFIMQYEVKFQNGQDCGGAYVKLLTKETQGDLKKFMDKTPYTIMFGPDKCGLDNKLHFIFRHKNPKTGKFEEKHAVKPKSGIEHVFTDKKTHLFTLVINPDNTFEILVDQKVVNSGSLLENMEPPVNPPKEITDPTDKKPADWDENEKIPDPSATKPDDWDESEPEEILDEDATMPSGWLEDEPELIPDPSAEKPSDWDTDMDGEWEAPSITNPKCESAPGCGPWKAPTKKNPKYKGKWRPPLIENPNYKGKWSPKKIPNPDFFEDKTPYKMTTIGAVGLELWSMSDEIAFDNFIITDDRAVADSWAADSWNIKYTQEGSSGGGVLQSVFDITNERPWLWAVFVFVIVLPLILIVYYCCCTGSSESQAQPQRVHRKKTDEPTPDDEQEIENKEEENENKQNDETKQNEETPKQNEETTKQNEETTKQNDESSGDKVRLRKKDSKKASLNETSASEEPEADHEGDGEATANTSSNKSPRKKGKSRKE